MSLITLAPFSGHAWDLASCGWSPIPIKVGTKRPAIDRWSDYCSSPLSDEGIGDLIDHGQHGIGVACGYNGLIAVDIDTEEPDIMRALRMVLPEGSVAKRGRKGRTDFYRDVSRDLINRKMRGRDGRTPIVEILATGCQTVLPPTVHPDTGRPYEWLTQKTLFNAEAYDLLEIRLEDIERVEAALRPWLAPRNAETGAAPFVPRPAIPLGQQEQTRYLRYAQAAVDGRCRELAAMGKDTGRNIALFNAVCTLGRYVHHGIIPYGDLDARLIAACESNGLLREDGRSRVIASIRSGMDRARNDQLPELGERPEPNSPTSAPRNAETVAAPAARALASSHDASGILDEIHAFLARFVSYPDEHAHVAHTLWIAHAHAMDAWESTPRIAFISPEPASGKSRALEITELLVPLPVNAVNVTPSYLFRKVGDRAGRPTILFDEIDTVFGPKAKENEEIRGLLNAGHRSGAVAGRCVVKGKIVTTEEIPAYCAVALAGLGHLPDTIRARSVIVRMRRRAPDEHVESYRRRIHAPQGEKLRDRLAEWMASIEDALADAWPQIPDGVADRDADVWEPLLAIAEASGSEWETRARCASVALVALAKSSDATLGVRLLSDIRNVFGALDAMTTKALLEALHEMDEAPWGDMRGKPLNDRKLARMLREYGIKPKTIRVGMGSTPKGYAREDFHDAWSRYLPPQSETSSATEAADTADVADVALF